MSRVPPPYSRQPEHDTERTPLAPVHNSARKRSSNNNHDGVLAIALIVFAVVAATIAALIGYHLGYKLGYDGRDCDEGERQKLPLYFDDVQPDATCSAYGTRKYTARLRNLSPSYDAIVGCMQTSLVVHDVNVGTPDFCDIQVWSFPSFSFLFLSFTLPPD